MTKSFWVLFLFLITYTLPSLSQEKKDKPPKGYLAITFGPTVVAGNFSENDWDNDSAGFAKNGINYTMLEFGFKFVPKFGLSASLKGGVIPLDVQAIADGYAKEYGGQFTVKSTRWGYTGFFIGPFLCIPTKYVDFDIKFATGLLFAEAPEMTVRRGAEVAGQESSIGGGIAIDGGIGARIHLSKKFGLITSADYHFSQPTFETDFYDTTNYRETVTTSQRFTMFNFTFGFVYRMF